MCCFIENLEILLLEERKLLLKGDLCLLSASSPSSSSPAPELFLLSCLSNELGKKKRGIPNLGSSRGLNYYCLSKVLLGNWGWGHEKIGLMIIRLACTSFF